MTTSPSLGTASPASARTPTSARIPLPTRVRKAALVVHVLAAAAWIGIDVMVAVLVAAGRFASDPAVQGMAYQALARFVVTPMLVSGLVCLATGLLLGLGTKWGLVRYWWVAVKLVLSVVLCTLIVVLLRPGMSAVAEAGDSLATGGPATTEVTDLFFPPAVSLTALTVAVVLSVFKPWGRITRRSQVSVNG